MDRKPLDLRDDEPKERKWTLPTKGFLIAGVILSITGILIAAILPELLAKEEPEEKDDLRTPLSILLTCTMDEITTEDSTYSDITIPQAYYAFTKNGNSNMSTVEETARHYLEYMIGESIPFELEITSGLGWENEFSHNIRNMQASGASQTHEQDVIVDVEEDSQITMIFKLTIWGVNE